MAPALRAISGSERRPPPPTQSDREEFDRSVTVFLTHLGSLQSALRWWSGQVNGLAKRIAADGIAYGMVPEKMVLGFNEGLAGLLHFGAKLSEMGVDCGKEWTRVSKAQTKLERRIPSEFGPAVWNKLVREATRRDDPHLVDRREVGLFLETIPALQAITTVAFSYTFLGSITATPLAIDRDLHGLNRIPTHLKLIEHHINEALIKAQAKAGPWIVSERSVEPDPQDD